MSTTRRLLLPGLLARLGTRALNAPGLSAYRPDAVGAVARTRKPSPTPHKPLHAP